MSARFIVGDVFDVLATLPDDSVDLVFSSPPFLALRSYLPADHPDKGKEIGSEATPADFLDTLLDVVEACDRVLAPHGSLCFELGDTYSGSGGAGGDYNADGLREGQAKFDGSNHRRGRIVDHDSGRRNPASTWPDAKSLCGIPTLFAWSLAYGRNLLRPERTTPRWRIRNVVVWARPNPPVGALGDKFRPATSYLTVACKSDRRWFDLDAVRTPHTEPGHATVNRKDKRNSENPRVGWTTDGVATQNPAGAPPLDYWEIPTQPYAGSHYATFPDKLVVKPVKAMCPSKVCRTCGQPSRRITETSQVATRRTNGRKAYPLRGSKCENFDQRTEAHVETVGWSDCGHDDWRPGVVLDPFAGSGTTLAVATGHGRDAIGIDIDERNADLALERVGPLLLTVEHLAKPVAS